MRYFLKIDDIIDEFKNRKHELANAPFWDRQIAISENLFRQIEFHKFVMVDNDDEEIKGAIQNFETYFDKSVHLHYSTTVTDKFSQTLKCKLAAYFVPDRSAKTPF